MTLLSNDKLLGQVAQGLAADGRALDALRREAQRNPSGAASKAAQQFEALFMQMVLKSMRDALPQSGMLDSAAQQMYAGMLDQQLAMRVAASGTGLADMIAKQLTRHMHTGAADRSDGEQRSSPTAAALPAARHAAPGRPDPNGLAHYAELLPGGALAHGRAADAQRAAVSGGLREPPGVEASPASAGDSVQRRFVLRHWDHALAAERQTGIAAKFIVAQAALESGWGQREIRDAAGRPSHNLFGIKAGPNWRGRTVEVTTTEYAGGVERQVVERFRAYDNYGEAFRDWAQLMVSNPRYAAVLRAGGDARRFAHGLQRAGYATDPQYGAKLAQLIDTAAALKGRA